MPPLYSRAIFLTLATTNIRAQFFSYINLNHSREFFLIINLNYSRTIYYNYKKNVPCKGYFYESSVLLFLVACGSFACALCSRKIAYIKYIRTPTPMRHLSAGIFSTHEKNFDRLYKYPSKTTVESGGTTISQPKGRLFAAFSATASTLPIFPLPPPP